MAKDAYYFSHDSNAKDDPKCVMLIEQLGLEGYGIYWVLIEMLRDQPEYKYPLSLIPAIARRYNTTSEKMRTVIGNYGLFTVDENDFFSLSLIKRMEHYEYKREIARAAGKKSAKVRALNSGSTDVQPTFNDGSTSKVNNSTVDQSIEDDNTIILQPYESEFISILQSLRDYPLDRVKDLEMLKTLEQRYPTLDIVESLKDWYIYKQDKPLKEKDNPRLQINTWCKKAIQYGKNIKVEPKPTFAKKVIR
ncbi:MAG: DUF4373 domain-containing protein [Bacillota bacterium]|nr:DUF4373 domain-containing protein [Bacillota bacterium]